MDIQQYLRWHVHKVCCYLWFVNSSYECDLTGQEVGVRDHLPPGVLVQLVEDRLLAELKDQVEPSLPPEHLQKVHQVDVLQLLHATRLRLVPCLNNPHWWWLVRSPLHVKPL